MSSRSTQIIGGPDREHAFVDTATNALLVKVVNPGGGGGGGNVNIAEVGGVAIGSTVPISDGGGSITVDGSLTATFGGLVSAGNATSTPLGPNATYTGTWEDVTNYATLTVTVFANVPSATDGMRFEWSGNGVNIDEDEAITISAAHPGRAMSFNVRGRYFRVVYTNGPAAQATFRLGVVYRPSGMGGNNHPLTDVLEDTTLALTTRSVIVGKTTGGGGSYENVKVTPSGALTVEINDGGGSITVDGTVAATQSGAWTVSVNEPVSVDDNGGSLTVDGTVAVSSVGGTVVVGDGGSSLTVDGTVAATQSGAWTVTAAQTTHNNLNANANIQVNDVDVSNANPVPISDAGGSLTVDGTVAVSSVGGTVTVADGGGSITVDGTVAVSSIGGTVTIAEPVSVDDNGGSLTVDGTVAVSSVGGTVVVGDGGGSLTVDGTVAVSSVSGTVAATQSGAWTVTAAQATHDNLNLNANLQVNNTDVSNSNRVPVGDGGGSLTVDDGAGSLTVDVISLSNSVALDIHARGGTARPADTGIAPMLEVTDDPPATLAAYGTSNGQWSPGFLDPVTGGIYVKVVNPGGASSNVNISQVGGVTIGSTVPVSDGGSSLTVDGTVAATQSGAWTVTATQATHNNLNLNANIQVADLDVGPGNPVPVQLTGSIDVTGSTVNVQSVATPGGSPNELARVWGSTWANTNVLVQVGGVVDPGGSVIASPGQYQPLRLDVAGRVQMSGDVVVTSVTPGTAADSLGKAEDTLHSTGATGVMALAVRNDSMVALAGSNSDYIPFSTDAVGRLQVIKSGGKATYRAATTNNVVAAAGAAMFFVITGSSTRTVTVQRITITCPTLTAVAYLSLVLERFSTAPTGGTAVPLTRVQLDTAVGGASTVNLCQVYTAAPTEGTLVGTLGCQRFLAQATTAAAAGTPPDAIIWDFRNGFGEGSGLALRGIAENVGVAFGAAPASAVTLSVEVEWTEE